MQEFTITEAHRQATLKAIAESQYNIATVCLVYQAIRERMPNLDGVSHDYVYFFGGPRLPLDARGQYITRLSPSAWATVQLPYTFGLCDDNN